MRVAYVVCVGCVDDVEADPLCRGAQQKIATDSGRRLLMMG